MSIGYYGWGCRMGDITGDIPPKIEEAIRDKNMLVPGKWYIIVHTMAHAGGKSFTQRVRFVRHIDDVWFEKERIDGVCGGYVREDGVCLESYCDCGITPYEDGKWNIVNFIKEEKCQKENNSLD